MIGERCDVCGASTSASCVFIFPCDVIATYTLQPFGLAQSDVCMCSIRCMLAVLLHVGCDGD